MTLEQQIQEDIKAAMNRRRTERNVKLACISEVRRRKRPLGRNAKDTVAMNAVRAVKGEILLFKTSEGGSKEVTDGDILKMIQKLPKQLSEAEVEAKIKEIIAQVGATSIKDMGKVMGAANRALAGLSDGRTISTIVKKLLN